MPPTLPQKASSTAATLLVQICAATTSLRRARQLHAHLLISPRGPGVSPSFLLNNILFMYARCGSLYDAHFMFDKMPHRKVVSYNALISAYSQTPRHAHMSFRLFDQLQHNESFGFNELTVTSILQASAAVGDLAVASLLHALCLKIGFLENVHIQTSLLGAYSKCGDMINAEKVFYQMADKDDVAWNSIISANAKNGRLLESFEIFRIMLREGIQPTQITHTSLLTACAKFEDYENGKLVHAQAILSSTYGDLSLQNALLDMYCSCGDTDTAFEIFTRIMNPDLVSWNSMMAGYSEKGDGDKVMDMFVQLKQGTSFKPDEYTLLAVVSGTAGFPARACGEPLHAQIEKTGLSRSVQIGSALISMYFKNDGSSSSKRIFDSFTNKDAVVWTDMVAGHVKIGESEDALKFFRELLREGCRLDGFAVSSALSACADLVTLRQGEMIHCLVVKIGNESEVCVRSNLIDMYAKNGELKAAARAFSLSRRSDLMCWNAMLTAYGNHGKAVEAFQFFYKMLKHSMIPDQVTYLSLLSACSHCGLVDESRYFWNTMKENGVHPGPKHYSCIIRILSRAGLWEEAEEMVAKSSPNVDDSLESWRTILSACIRGGNLRMGIATAERILKINGDDRATNVLLAKLYAASGRWNDVAKTWRRMKGLMVEKDPGLSWIEMQNNVHVFSSDDGLHLQSCEVKDEIKRLLGNMSPSNIIHDVLS